MDTSTTPGADPGHPDYRFTLANERTFLAWLRTSLALLAGGVAIVTLVPGLAPQAARLGIGLALLTLAALVAAGGYRRWTRNEQALRRGAPLPTTGIPGLVAGGLLAITLALVVVLLTVATGHG